MKLSDLDAVTITRPVERKDCVICSDTPPPQDDQAILAAGVICLCEKHEAGLRDSLSRAPKRLDDLLHRVFGPIV